MRILLAAVLALVTSVPAFTSPLFYESHGQISTGYVGSGDYYMQGSLGAYDNPGDSVRIWFSEQPRGTMTITIEETGESYTWNLSNVVSGQALNVFESGLFQTVDTPISVEVSGKFDIKLGNTELQFLRLRGAGNAYIVMRGQIVA